MKPYHLLQIQSYFYNYKFALLSFVTAFVITLLVIPPIISFVKRYGLYDMPNARKEHRAPVPTLGGIAIVAGMMLSLLLWFPFRNEMGQVSFFLAITVLCGLGVMDDLKDLSARYKFIIQIGLASLIALSGIRIYSFDGLFGLYEISVVSQYTLTVLAIVGITNAFNLIDGIDGLAGGLGFMSLLTVGIFLTATGDNNTALVAFALAGGILAFLYFNFNPARIFMGDTGSLVLGFVIAVLCIRLLQVNTLGSDRILQRAPVFVMGIVFVPAFDTLRVFALRIWKGQSPFVADRTHIHHLLTDAGFSHGFAVRVICLLHAFILINIYLFRNLRQEFFLFLLFAFMVLVSIALKHSNRLFHRWNRLKTASHSETMQPD